MIEKLLDEKQVADVLSCSVSKLRQDRWLNRGIRYHKHGRLVRYCEADVQKFIDDHRVETGR